MLVNNIRIAFVASSFVVGGAERVMFDLITRLPQERYESRLYFIKGAGTLGTELFQRGIEGAERLLYSRFDIFAFRRLARHLKDFRPHILFCLDHRNTIILGGLAASTLGIPRRIVASHSTGRFGKKRNFTFVERIFIRGMDRFVAISEAHAAYTREVEGIDAEKIVVIENGIETRRFSKTEPVEIERVRTELGLSSGDRVVIMVAVLRPEKAHEALLDAAKRLVVSYSGLKFLIVGDGPRRAYLEEQKREKQLGENVYFLGQRRDVETLLHLSDILVLPSHPVVETMPLAVLEAMAAGVPVVASAVGSIPELVEDGVSGRLIPPADPVALAAAIAGLLDDEASAGRIAENARRIVEERYSVDRMVSKYEALFESVLS